MIDGSMSHKRTFGSGIVMNVRVNGIIKTKPIIFQKNPESILLSKNK